MTQWQARIRSEEQYIALKRDSDEEMSRVKDLLAQRTHDVERMSREAAEARKEKAVRQNMKEAPLLGKQHRSNVEEQLELLHKIARLEEEISKLRLEQEREKKGSRRHKDEIEAARTKMREQFSELESQQKRFLSLKKNFNDLRDENEKLRLQLRNGRRSVNPNNTWPKNSHADVIAVSNAAAKTNSENETVTLLDIPATKLTKQNVTSSSMVSAPAAGGKKGVKTSHKRTSSDARASENLPPVLSNGATKN